MQEVFDMYEDSVFRAANGMGAGLAYKKDVCGSLLGAYMMLGLKLGLGREQINSLKPHPVYPVVQEFYDWFTHEFSASKCPDIRAAFAKGLNFDHLEPQQREKAIFDELHRRCDQLTGKVAMKITGILWEAIFTGTTR